MKELGKEVALLVKHSGIYGVGFVLSKTVGFLMIPVYTRYLSPKDYGVLELLDLIIFFVGIFVAAGIQAAVFRFYAAYNEDRDKKEVVMTAYVYTAAANFLFTLFLTIWAEQTAHLVLGSASYAHLVRVVAWTLSFASVCEIPLCYWRAREQSAVVMWIGLGRTVLGASTLAFALAVAKGGIVGAVYANLVANGLAGIVLSIAMFRTVPFGTSIPKLKEMLRFAIPLIPLTFCSFVLTFSDRFFLREFATLAEVGVYSLAYKLGAIVALLVNGPFGMVWAGRQFELAKRDDGPHMYAKIATYLMFLSLLTGLGISIFSKEVITWFVNRSYWGARTLVPLIAFTYVLQNLRAVTMSGIFVKKDTKSIAVVSVVTTILNLGLNYVLIKHFFAFGAASATLLTFVFNLLFFLYIGQRAYYVRYEYGRMMLSVVAAIGLYIVSTLNHRADALGVLFDFLLVGTFALCGLRLLDKEERGMLRGLALRVWTILRRAFVREHPYPTGGTPTVPPLDA